MASTPVRNVRVPDEIWKPVQVKAADQGVTVTDVIVVALEKYLADDSAPLTDLWPVSTKRLLAEAAEARATVLTDLVNNYAITHLVHDASKLREVADQLRKLAA